jgi:hypothetical protein
MRKAWINVVKASPGGSHIKQKRQEQGQGFRKDKGVQLYEFRN